MKVARRKLLVEPPATAAPDIAFILIVFFLVCASVQPDSGKPQDIPRSEEAEMAERFGEEYRRYAGLTPRFLPRWGERASAAKEGVHDGPA